ncbi:MAG TPA: ROK family transcriptional regulator [Pyrinomonadaceae bacterium]|nr:ROK family transcriptional regulator [Pyrinomonadaceae bacterium]
MNNSSIFQTDLANSAAGTINSAKKGNLLLKLIRAAQPITRNEIASRLDIDKSTVTDNVKPLIKAGILREETLDSETSAGQGRRPRVLSFTNESDYFIGVNLGVRRSQIGLTALNGEILSEDDFETPADAATALKIAREKIENLYRENERRNLRVIGVSVPGMTDAERRRLLFAPNLDWHNVAIADAFQINSSVKIVVENDATAAAMYEARMKIRHSNDGLMTNFILIRSGTGIGVGLVIGSEVYRGTGLGRGIAGEFGHMTIVAGGKPCVCGNRGCWEKYASAASAASLYLGDRPLRRGETAPRFIEIVNRAENGEIRAQRTLEKIGDYLGIGIANVIMGVGIPRVIISGRLVYGWKFIREPLNKAIERSIVGKLDGWSVEAGEPVGSAIGGALEVAVEEYLAHSLVM